ncbi:MAG: putative metal-binding motif-containing protein [Myxococcota bacterium]
MPGYDEDGDGYCENESPTDCNDGDPDINPAEAEDGTDRVDEDCDGSPSVRRPYVVGFEGLNDWTTSGDVISGGGQVVLRPTATTPAAISLRGDLAHDSGLFTVTVGVPFGGPYADCTVEVHHSGGTAWGFFDTPGEHALTFSGVEPGSTITDLDVECDSLFAYTMPIDWLTVQNGTYEWAPLMDVTFEFDGMGVPGGGRQSVVRVSDGYGPSGGITGGGLLLAGSDVGGLAWSPAHDPESVRTVWYTANGGYDDWNDGSEMGVGEILALWRGGGTWRNADEFDVYALTGNETSGGLWQTADITGASTGGQEWDEVSSGVWAFKHLDDCQWDGKELSSGRLLETFPGFASWLLVASNGVKSGAGSTRGLHVWQRGSSTPPAEIWSGLPEGATYAGLPSAIVTGEGDDVPFVVVGYRVLADDAYVDAVYLCPANFDPASVPSPAPVCVPVDGGPDAALDVRDIEADPTNDGTGWERFYIADGGRSWDPTLDLDDDAVPDGGCQTGEPTVYALDVDTNATADASLWATYLWDTDGASTSPAWIPAGEPYYTIGYTGTGAGHAGCLDNASATAGSLIAPVTNLAGDDTLEAHDLSAIAVSPGGAWLFAFYPKGNTDARWGCASTFRGALSGLAQGATVAWRPFQDYQFGHMGFASDPSRLEYGPHSKERRDAVEVAGSYIEDEPFHEAWAATSVHDAVFVPGPTGGAPDLLVGGAQHWWIHHDADGAGIDVGWDTTGVSSESDGCSVGGQDLDCVDITLAWAGDAGDPVFQDLTASAAGVCPGCAVVGEEPVDALLAGGTGDYKYYRLFAEAGGVQEPGERPCEFHPVGSFPVDVEVWADPNGTSAAQAWMAFSPQDLPDEEVPIVDIGRTRGLFFSEETGGAEIGEEWCWDGIPRSAADPYPSFAGWNFVGGGGIPSEELVCADYGWNSDYEGTTDEHGYPACSTDVGNPTLMDDAGIGMIWALEVLGEDTAVIAAVAACAASGCEEEVDPEPDDSAGLWVVTHTASGLEYVPVPFPAGGIPSPYDSPNDNCSREEFFQYDYTTDLENRRLAMSVHPSSGPALGDWVRLFVSSSHPHCGVAEVSFERGNEAGADWELLELDHDGTDAGTEPDCKLWWGEEWQVNGTHASRDGRWLFVYGGQAVNPSYADAVCAIDLSTEFEGDYTSFTPVASNVQMKMSVHAMASHPHVEDLWYFGGWVGLDDTATHPGVFALQRRLKWSAGAWTTFWSFLRVSDDDLQARTVSDLGLGPGTGTRTSPVRFLYVSTGGGSWWDGEASW